MSSPLQFFDPFNISHTEPSVTGFIRLQETEPVRPDPVSTVIVMSPYRSGIPLQLNQWKRVQNAADYHDPDRTGDQGVALIRTAKDGISEQDMFGAADLITCRIDPATPSSSPVAEGAEGLGTLFTTDCGSHTRRAWRRFETGTAPGSKKLTLGDDNPRRSFTRDNLGPALHLLYTGNASAAVLNIRRHDGIIAYTGQASDDDFFSVNGTAFEFAATDDDHIAAARGATADATWAGVAALLNAGVIPGITAVHDAAANTVTLKRNGRDLNDGDLSGIQVNGDFSFSTPSVIHYTGTPFVNDQLIDNVSGLILQFVTVTAGHVAVALGDDADASWANFAAIINGGYLPGVTAGQNTASDKVTVSSVDDGIVLVLGTGVTFTVAAAGDPVHVGVTLTDPTDGSTDLSIPVLNQQYKTLSQIAAFINNQVGYEASVITPAINRSLPSTGLDVVSDVDVKTSTVTLTAYMAAIAQFVNQGTRHLYSITVTAQGEPDNDVDGGGNPIKVFFTGGVSPAVTTADWENALSAIGQGVETGGILLPDTDDPAIMAMIVAFIDEQLAAGKWFRAFFGAAAALEANDYLQIATALDHPNTRLFIQRPGFFGASGTVEYQPPIFAAAAVAGAAGGNRPYVNPLTNKRFRFAAIHPDDQFPLVQRENFLDGGISIFKSELGTIRLALCVTTSRDPDKRMARIASEIDTLKEIDSTMRERFRKYRGKWVNDQISGAEQTEMLAVLDEYKKAGAIVDGVDDYGVPRKAYKLGDPPVEIFAGVANLNYDLFIGGELNHIVVMGNADYQRIRGSVTSTSGNFTAVQI